MCRESWYIAENAAHEASSRWPRTPRRRCLPTSASPPTRRCAELGRPVGTRDLAAIAEACARGRDDLAGRGHEAGGRKTLRLFSTWEITRYLIPVAQAHFRRVLRANPALPQGRTETDGRRQVVHPRRGPAAARPLRRRGQPRQALRPVAPGRPAGQGRGHRQLQGRRRQDLDGGAPRDVGRPRRLPRPRRRPRQPGLDDLDLRRQGRLRVGHGLPARSPATTPSASRPRTAAGPSAATPPLPLDETLDAALGKTAADVIQQDPLAEHRPDRRPAQPLLGRVPDPGLAHEPARLEALGGARQRLRARRRPRRATTSSSSIPPLPSAT